MTFLLKISLHLKSNLEVSFQNQRSCWRGVSAFPSLESHVGQLLSGWGWQSHQAKFLISVPSPLSPPGRCCPVSPKGTQGSPPTGPPHHPLWTEPHSWQLAQQPCVQGPGPSSHSRWLRCPLELAGNAVQLAELPWAENVTKDPVSMLL